MSPAPSAGRARGGNSVAAQDERPAARAIAYTHQYQIEAEPAQLRAVLDAHSARCAQLDCVMVSRTFSEGSQYAPPDGALTVRVAHKDRDAFTATLRDGSGHIVRQSTSAEDKTLQVADVEARAANLTQLRDRLRQLLSDPKAGIKEAVEIERQLAQTQGEIDSLQAQRKVLAQETERELFEISYRATRSAIEQSIFTPVTDALVSFGRIFMMSLGVLIQFVAASLVWVLLLGVAMMLVRRWWRGRKAVGRQSSNR